MWWFWGAVNQPVQHSADPGVNHGSVVSCTVRHFPPIRIQLLIEMSLQKAPHVPITQLLSNMRRQMERRDTHLIAEKDKRDLYGLRPHRKDMLPHFGGELLVIGVF